jgi:hypothetical protein
MTTTPTTPALELGNSSLAAVQSQFAQVAKSMLSGYKSWGELQGTAGIRLLHALLDVQPPAATLTMQNLLGLPFGLATDLAAQQKESMQGLLLRNNALMADLRKSQTKDDISLVMAGYMSDVEGLVRDNGGKVMGLLNSASAATTVLTERTLDDLIAAGPRQLLPSPV